MEWEMDGWRSGSGGCLFEATGAGIVGGFHPIDRGRIVEEVLFTDFFDEVIGDFFEGGVAWVMGVFVGVIAFGVVATNH